MNIERAQRHVKRAHDLLGFGGLTDLSEQIRKKIERYLSKQEKGKLDQTSQPYNKLRQGWIWNNEEVMDNEELVRAACSVDPHAFGYASERLQKNKELATWVFNQDQDAILAYSTKLNELKPIIEELQQSRQYEKLMKIVSPRILTFKSVDAMKWQWDLMWSKLNSKINARNTECKNRQCELTHGLPPKSKEDLKVWTYLAAKNRIAMIGQDFRTYEMSDELVESFKKFEDSEKGDSFFESDKTSTKINDKKLFVIDQAETKTRAMILEQLREGWIMNDEDVMNDRNLVISACTVNPRAFGYASERLQKNKELATWVFNQDQDAILAYSTKLNELKPIIEELKQSRQYEKLFEIVSPRVYTYNSVNAMITAPTPIITRLREAVNARNKECELRQHELTHGIPPKDKKDLKAWIYLAEYNRTAIKIQVGKDFKKYKMNDELVKGFQKLENSEKGDSFFES